MKKIKRVEHKSIDLNDLLSTKYDDLFKSVIRSRGVSYYLSNRINKFHKEKNKISAIIRGTKEYHVSIEYLDNDNIDVKCECPYHKETDKYCKHVYALLLNLKLIYEMEKLDKIYKNNINRIKELIVEIETKTINNKDIISNYHYERGTTVKDRYYSLIKEMNDKYNKNDIYRFTGMISLSFYYLNDIINEYNYLVDEIEYDKKVKEQVKNDTVEYTWHIGEDLFDTLDNVIADVPLPILEKARQMDIEDGEDTEIIDKAIKERKRRDKLIRIEKEREAKEERKFKKQLRRASFFGLLSGLFDGLASINSTYPKKEKDDNALMGWEQDLVDKGEYEPYNFEEEDMDEEDFYYEDD